MPSRPTEQRFRKPSDAPCPTCRRAAGQLCVSPCGRVLHYTHTARARELARLQKAVIA